jgi:exodeoxyribonuclease V gamma subunit
MTASPIHPGFMALYSHRAENLLETVVAWLQAHPLGPLEEEVFIVQSNAVAEWLKMALARDLGVCAATRVELPARFFWRTSRQVLGRAAVPVESPLDKVPLTWRLMQTLPALLADPAQVAVYAPVAGFVHTEGGGAPPLRMLQLCQRLADLYDQYQVYRPDWLQDWAVGRPQLLAGDGRSLPVPAGQVWQAALWQHLMAGLEPTQCSATRPNLHQRVIARLAEAAPRSDTAEFGDASAHSNIGSSFHAHAEAEVDVDAYRAADGPVPLHGLPRRVVAFGMSHLPQGLLDMLGALSSHTQVLLAVPNPCQYHWADVIDGRELLRMQHRRHALKGGIDLSTLPLADMHAHAHPLLAAWGRQSRDFVRLLDAFDASAQARFQPDWPRLDLFDDPARPDGLTPADLPQPTLLQQIQLNIRDLVPMAAQTALQQQPGHSWLPGDQSIVFHVAHSAVRELEVLHDQLLALLADGGTASSATVGQAAGKAGGQSAGQEAVAGRAPLRPRDVVVMVPDIAAVAPAVQAVFGQYPRGDARHIPFDIADMGAESLSPLMAAWQWLWTLPHQRAAYSEWLALLEVPAVQARFGLTADDLPRLSAWMAGAGLRWGLHQGHRSHLGLAECGEQNSARFALRRMLTGFMVGDAPHALHASQTVGADVNDIATQADGTEPYAEVGGLDASLAGALAHVLDALDAWWVVATVPATPAEWVARGRALAAALFQSSPTGQAATAAAREADEQALAALHEAGQRWLQACEQAGFAEVVDLDVARTAWDHALVSPSVDTRFQAGGVTFCTLMPMRAIPFRVVCLLGMNDADYPRRASQSDFDLMAQPGMTRPGDRARRDDDRQLMLEALMSARDVFYLSWAGRSVRDNTEQPPSVLVSQLRDHIATGWGPHVLPALTTEHPLQPFSRRYFEATGGPTGAKLFTHAHEWRDMHVSEEELTVQSEMALEPDLVREMVLPAFMPDPAVPLTLRVLADALRHPVKAFFKRRLGVDFGREDDITPDEEPFGVDGLTTYGMLRDALVAVPPDATLAHAVDAAHATLGSLQRSGALPMGAMGDLATTNLTAPLTQMLVAWFDVQRAHTQPAERLRVTHSSGDVVLQDWVDGLWCADAPGQGPPPLSPSVPPQPQAEPQTPTPDHAQTEALLEGQPCRDGPRVWLGREVSRLVGKPATRDKPAELRADKLLGVWLRCLVLSAFDAKPVMRPNHHAVVVARDATLWVMPLPPAEARDTLDRLLAVWLQSMQAPLPLPPKTALKWLADHGDGHVTRECYEGGYQQTGEGQDPFWQRMYPDFEALTACGAFETLVDTVYAPLQHWVNTCIQVVPHPQPDAPERVTPAVGAHA